MDICQLHQKSQVRKKNYGIQKGYTSTMPDDIEVQKSLYINWTGDTEVTTNACESFHSAFGKYFYSAQPNIFVFFEV